MKLTKKIVSAALALTMTLSLVTPAMAVTPKDTPQNEAAMATVIDETGNELSFQMIDNNDGTYTMEYYYNGELDTTYTISTESSYIQAKTTDGEEYSINTEEYIQSDDSQQPMLTASAASNPVHFCTIYYNANSAFSTQSAASVEMTYTAKNVTKKFVTQANTRYADAVATVSSYIIGAGLALFVVSGGSAVAVAAGAVVTAMIANAGAQLVGGVIKDALSDSFVCSEVTYSYPITLVTEKFTKTGTLSQAGISDYIYYDNGEVAQAYDGFTPTTIRKTDEFNFALEVWKKCAPNYSMPSVKSYSYYA